jgi:hypothetical protein
MKWNSVIGALVIGAGLCNPSYGFEWLDRLIGIDLDNSEAAPAYSYSQAAPIYHTYSTGYAPYSVGYPAAVSNGCNTCAPTYGAVPQTNYRTVYQPMPVTSYQPASTCGPCGNQVTAMRPVVTYRVQPQVMPYTVNQPVYAPATSYAPAPCGCSTGN